MCSCMFNRCTLKCTCSCHKRRSFATGVATLKKRRTTTEYWVTERPIGLEPPNEQMRFLNDLLTDSETEYVLQGCDPQGHYIFKLMEKRN